MPDAVPLASRIRAAAAHREGTFIDEGQARSGILVLAAPSPEAERRRGKSLLLAIPGQLATLAALAQLDGVARRLVLWPRDAASHDLEDAAARAGVDEILRDWPLPKAVPAEVLTELSGPCVPATEWVLLTSGTTGRPKLIVHTLQSLAGHLHPTIGTPPVWATFYDTRRYGGLQIALRALVGGASLVLADPAEAVAAFLTRSGQRGVTHILGTPSHWRLALMAGAPALIAPQTIRLSGEVSDQAILDRLSEAFPNAALVHAFASTEAGLAFEITDRRAGFPASLVGAQADAMSTYRPMLLVQDGTLRICSGRCASGTLDGTIVPLPSEQGFVDTGDAVQCEDGRYYFAGRRDGVVNVGGLKVYPEEVEAVINAHPSVRMCRVTARHSPITGAVVTADIVRRGSDSADASHEDLAAIVREFCGARLPRHKVPVSIRIVSALPVSAGGKLMRARA